MSGLSVRLLTPRAEVSSLECASLTVPGKLGYMGILPGHCELVAELGAWVLTVAGKESHDYFIPRGFLDVRNNSVVVMADSLEASNDIDKARAGAALKRASERLAKLEAGVDVERALASKRRAELRVEFVSKDRR